MDSVANRVSAKSDAKKTHVRSQQLLSLLDEFSVKVLSLDCFDTIIWRHTATPVDVFFTIQEKPSFKSLGFTARMRAQAEGLARQKMYLDHGKTEIKLPDIYRALFPNLTNEEIQSLADDELAAEIESTYVLPPAIELIRAAKKRGLPIIIVSDTYLSEPELRRLLTEKLPKDVLDSIDKIYCSSEMGKAKGDGLFPIILKELKEVPSALLHIGDHIIADYVTPQALGINAVQLIHYDKHVGDSLRMQALAGGFIDPAIRHQRALASPFRGLFATTSLSKDKPESTIGYASVGQIMYSFAQFILEEVEELKQQGKKPKVLFLMRDAYLPSLVCEALAGQAIGKCVRISRFASFAASFRSKEDIDRYIGDNVLSFRFYDICKQLLIPEPMAKVLIQKAVQANNPAAEFIKLIHLPETLKTIINESKAYYERLKHHLEKEVGLEKGDTLVFVDLGYTGTAQVKLEPIFKKEMDVTILGRYLISLSTPNWQQSRKGLLDASWCDERTMHMLVSYIALLEQICTAPEKSVIDYQEDGTPIYSETSVSKGQHSKLELIQAECIRFAKEAKQFFDASGKAPSSIALRDAAMAELGRLLFLPSQTELDFLQSFEFDLNLGTKDLLEVFDQEKGLMGLRKRGLFFMEKNLKSMRTNYPAELRSAGMELVLTLMAHHRYEFDVRVTDLSLRREVINVIAIKGGQSNQTKVEALPTHDGYFSLIVPIGNGEFQIGLQFGLQYQWIQIESADVIVVNTLYGSKESENTKEVWENLVFDQMVEKGNHLYESLSNAGLIVYLPTSMANQQAHYALRIVFRPIARWQDQKKQSIN